MEFIFKASIVSVSALVISLLIKKTNPEISTLMTLSTIAILLFASLTMLNGLKDLRQAIERIFGTNELYIKTLIKCLGIALITKFSSDLCKDCSNSSLASSLEFCGAVSAFLLVSPLLMSLLKIIGGLV